MSSFCLGPSPTDHIPSKPPPKGEPDPKLFNVLALKEFSNCHILVVHYPNCTNYEGRKVLLIAGPYDPNLTFLDPHFTDDSQLLARFRPTPAGLRLAELTAKAYSND